MARENLTQPGTAPSATAEEATEKADKRPICVIDDDDWVCEAITEMLEAHRFTVAGYQSGVEFLADTANDRAQCLVIDQHMPGMAGLDVIAALHRDGRLPPTILITGRPDAAIARRAGELGVHAVLEKPFRMAQLVALVEGALAV